MSILNLTPEANNVQKKEPISTDNKETMSTETPGVTDNTVTITPEQANQNNNNSNKTVIMDGPLSRIYTEALNIALAVESSAASSDTDILMVFDEEEADEETRPPSDLYVYCCKGDDLDSSEALKAIGKLRVALDSKTNKNVLLALEMGKSPTNSSYILEQYAFDNGIKVTFRPSVTLETIKNSLS